MILLLDKNYPKGFIHKRLLRQITTDIRLSCGHPKGFASCFMHCTLNANIVKHMMALLNKHWLKTKEKTFQKGEECQCRLHTIVQAQITPTQTKLRSSPTNVTNL